MEYCTEFLWKKNKREINEDALSINQVVINNSPLLLAVVCDGIGSLSDGELASSMVVSSLKTVFEGIRKDRNPSIKKISHKISRQLYECHIQLQEINTGTTVCLALIYKNRVCFISMGDSRIYKGKGRLKQISHDMVDRRGRLTAAIGVGTYKGIKAVKRNIRKGEYIVLCTDGFYRRNNYALCQPYCFRINMSEEMLREKLESMNNSGTMQGEQDNASAIVICRKK